MKWFLDIVYIALGASYRWILVAVAVIGILVGALFAAGVLGGGDDDDADATPFATPVPLPTVTPGPSPTAVPPSPTPEPTAQPTATTAVVAPTNPPPSPTPTPTFVIPSEIRVPINLGDAINLGSLEFVVAHDPDVLSMADVELGSLGVQALLESSDATPGLLWIGVIDADGISGDGPVAVVTFTVLGSSGTTTQLALENVLAYDASSLLDMIVEASPGSYSTVSGDLNAPSLNFAP